MISLYLQDFWATLQFWVPDGRLHDSNEDGLFDRLRSFQQYPLRGV